MSVEYMKFTYHDGDKKLNAYLKVDLAYTMFATLKNEVNECLFGEHKLPRNELRYYWIDDDNDEIEIVNHSDYEIFMSKRTERRHLHVASVKQQELPEESATATKQSSSSTAAGVSATKVHFNPNTPADDPALYTIHDHVECDGCGVAPMVGFRYKCIQCPNYDLCERCEAQHKHVDHMMVRMPNTNCPNVVEAWISGRYGRRGKRAARAAGACPFMPTQQASANEAAGDNSGPTERESHRHHKHHRRQMRHGIFSHLYDMMTDLAEGGAAAAEQGEEKAEAATVQARAAAEEATKAAHAAASKATEAAIKAAEAATSRAAKAAEAAASHVAHDIATAYEVAAAATFTPPNERAEKATETPQQSAHQTPRSATGTNTPNNSTNTTPVLNSPTLENLAQFIDPQYMKAGIQILNNFSEMFAKMLDPADGSESGCPFQNGSFQTRKSSDASAASTSSAASQKSSTGAEPKVAKNTEQPEVVVEPQQVAAVPQQVAAEPQQVTVAATSSSQVVSTAATPADSTTPTKEAQTPPSRRRSQSWESEWQLIDQHQATGSSDEAATATPAATAPLAAAAATNVDGAAAATAAAHTNIMNFEQLSKDLRAHVEQEQQRAQQAQEAQIAAATVTNTTAAVTAPVAPIIAPSMPTTTPVARPRTPEEKRAVPVFHTDPRINNAVLAMMAMGFSNEGAWLTQLLESVNGNIPEALDLMSAAQRRNQ